MKVKFDSVFDSILPGEFPTNTRANNINTKVISNDMKMKLVSLNKNKMVYGVVSVVKSVHNSVDSLRTISKTLIKFREFSCSTGYLFFFHVIWNYLHFYVPVPEWRSAVPEWSNMNYKEDNPQKKIIILDGTHTDKNALTIRGRRSSLFKNPSLGGTYTLGCRRPIRSGKV